MLARSGGAVRWFEVPPDFYSHTLNAFDTATSVVVDLISNSAPFFVAGRGSGGPASVAPPALHRWTIDLARGRVSIRQLDDFPQEFPRVRESVVSRPHRYGYIAAAAEMFQAYGAVGGVRSNQAFSNALVKHDLARGSRQIHQLPRGAAASEAVFVPSAGPGRAEDDGYALAYVHDPERAAADLVVLAAQDFTGRPLARIHLPGRVPLGFHGHWIPDA